MYSDPVTCPYCNALVAVAPGAVEGQRIPCPRCGEAFPLLRAEPPAASDNRSQPDPSAITAEPPKERKHWSFSKPVQANRRLVLIVLGVMTCMAAGALAFALSTESFRRGNDKGLTKGRPKRRPPLEDTSASAETPTPPKKLAALAWLPPDTNLIVGVHVHEIARNNANRALLTQPLKPVLFNNARVTIETLTQATGFKLDDIDHLVLGVKVDDAVFPLNIPHVTLIVRTRRDYDPDELLKRLNAERAGTSGSRTLYEFHVTDTFKPGVCCLDNQTVAFALVPNQLKAIPASPRTNLGQLPREVRDVLQERVGPGGPLWIAGHSDDWSQTFLRALFKEPARVRLSKVRAFAAWVQLDDPVLVQAAFHCGSDPAAQDLQKYLNIPDAGADPDEKAFRADGWLTVQIRTTLDKVLSVLE
jgi:hypothetical protein